MWFKSKNPAWLSEDVLEEVHKWLVTQPPSAAHDSGVSLQVDAHGRTYITSKDHPSQYLCPPSVHTPGQHVTYSIKLDQNGRQYVTDGANFSKWVSDFFPGQDINLRSCVSCKRSFHLIDIQLTCHLSHTLSPKYHLSCRTDFGQHGPSKHI